MFYALHIVRVFCDLVLNRSILWKLGLEIKPSTHTATQADRRTKLTVCGEAAFALTLSDRVLHVEAIVMKDLIREVIRGAPFLESKNTELGMRNTNIVIDRSIIIPYSQGHPRRPSVAI